MKGLRLCAIAVALHALTSAAQLSAPSPLPTARKRTISGTVVNAVTGDPIPRALVEFSGGSSGLTDGSGHFEFQIPANIQGAVAARKPGFFNEQQISQGEYLESLMAGGPASKPLVVKLIPEGVIFGQVNSEAGPIEGVTVTAVASRIRDGRKVWEGLAAATTNEDGAFRISNLMPSSYYLSVGSSFAPNLFATGTPPRARGYPKWFFPGVAELSTATPLEVAAGQQVQADLNPKLLPMFEISGNISGLLQGGGVGLQFQTGSGELSAFGMNFDQTTGNFRTKVPAGSYVLKARAQSSNYREVIGMDLPINVTGDLRGISLAMAPMASIPINVHAVKEGESTSGRRLPTRSEGGMPLAIRLLQEFASLNNTEYFAQRSGPEGDQGLSFINVEPGRYLVEVNTGAPWYVARAQCGNTDLLRDSLEIHLGSRTPPIEVELREDGAEVRAKVQVKVPSEGPAGSVWILLVSSRSPAETQARQVPIHADAVFQNLAPGEYTVLAVDNIDGIEYKAPEGLNEFMGKAVRVVLEPDQYFETNLELVLRTR